MSLRSAPVGTGSTIGSGMKTDRRVSVRYGSRVFKVGVVFGFGEVHPFRENIVVAPPRVLVGMTFRDWEQSIQSNDGIVDVNVFAGGQTHG